jgi:hypothetical protein
MQCCIYCTTSPDPPLNLLRPLNHIPIVRIARESITPLLPPQPRGCRRSLSPSHVPSRLHDLPHQSHTAQWQFASSEWPFPRARSVRMRRYALPIRRSSRLCSSWGQRGYTDVTHPFAFTFPVRLEEVDALRGVSGVHPAPTVAADVGRSALPARITHLVAVVVRSFQAVQGGFTRRFARVGKLRLSAAAEC